MKYLKLIGTAIMVFLLTYVTSMYLANVNYEAFGEFTPIPHFFPNIENSFKYSFLLFLLVFVIFGIYFLSKKYINLMISLLGMLLGVFKYKSVVESFGTVQMGFVPGLVEFAKLLCIFMLVGILVQWLFDIGIFVVKKVSK